MTVGVLELLTMTEMLLIRYHMVVVPTCGGAGDSGSIGVADNDCDVADMDHMAVGSTCGGAGDSGSIGVADNGCDVANKVSYGGCTYLWRC